MYVHRYACQRANDAFIVLQFLHFRMNKIKPGLFEKKSVFIKSKFDAFMVFGIPMKQNRLILRSVSKKFVLNMEGKCSTLWELCLLTLYRDFSSMYMRRCILLVLNRI